MKMGGNNKGFTAVEGILIVVLLGLLGAIGWFVYERSNDDASDETQIASTSETSNEVPQDSGSSDSATTDAMSLEKTFEAGGKTVAFNYPVAWTTIDGNKGEFAVLTHTKGYTLRFIGSQPDLSGFDVVESEVTLGNNSYKKQQYSQGGINSLILYTPKFSAPFTNAWLDVPNDVSSTIVEEVEQILATVSVK